jgi:hypothetical protein
MTEKSTDLIGGRRKAFVRFKKVHLLKNIYEIKASCCHLSIIATRRRLGVVLISLQNYRRKNTRCLFSAVEYSFLREDAVLSSRHENIH